MSAHKFVVGETINFQNVLRTRSAATGPYRVVGHRPVTDGEPWYIIKSELERHDRVVAESELR